MPRSSKSEIVGAHDGFLKVKIASPPVDGQANEAIIKFFSKIFKLPKSNVSIVKGAQAKKKKIRLAGVDLNNIISIIKLYV